MNNRRNNSLPTLKIESELPKQPQKPRLGIPAKPQPGRSRSKWSMLASTKPEAELFASDDQRSIQAYNALEKLAAETGIGDHGFETLNLCRASEYFRELKAKLDRNEKLVLSEYLYYALTTDDVNTVSIELLEAVTKRKDLHGFENNLQALLAARKWQEATDPDEKTELAIRLRKALVQRGYHERQGYNRCEYHLNLHGMNLAGADLSFGSLDFTDLENANLSGCNLTHLHIMYSNLNHANCSNAYSHSPGNPYTEANTKIEHTTAMDANFEGFKADNISFKYSDFTGSKFTNADIMISIPYDRDAAIIFTFADFNGANIRFAKQHEDEKNIFADMRFCNLINCTMHNADSNRIDMIGAIMFTPAAFGDHPQFKQELEQVIKQLVLPITTDEISQKEKDVRLFSMKQCIASVLLDNLEALSLAANDKIDLINIALLPSLLGKNTGSSILPAPVGSFFHSINTTLFGEPKTSDGSATAILETELHKLTTPVPSTGIVHAKH